MTDAFSNFSVAVVKSNQWAKTVAKALVERWFYTYEIPSRICSDHDKSFDNKSMNHLCVKYRIKQARTTLYNPCSNSKCKGFNRTFHNLLKILLKSWKPNWSSHLNSLVFANNVMANATIGLQPYQLLFDHKV